MMNNQSVLEKKQVGNGGDMSQFGARDVSISVNETGEKVDGKRVIDGYILELSNNLSCSEISGRSDWFVGKGFNITVEQAEILHKQLGESLNIIKPLIESETIIVKQSVELNKSSKKYTGKLTNQS